MQEGPKLILATLFLRRNADKGSIYDEKTRSLFGSHKHLFMRKWRDELGIDLSLVRAVVCLSTAHFASLITSSCGLKQRFKRRFATVTWSLVLCLRRRYWFGRATGARPSSFLRLYQSRLQQGQRRAASPVDGGDRSLGAVQSSVAARLFWTTTAQPCVGGSLHAFRPGHQGRMCPG